MQDLRMMFCVIQPPIDEEEPRDIRQDYFKQAQMCIGTLVKTGFPGKKITCISASRKHARRLRSEFGIDSIYLPQRMPKQFTQWTKRSIQHFYYYKPFAFSQVMPKAVDDNTVMAFADIDILWKRNPHTYFSTQEFDVWCNRGSELPRQRKKPPPGWHDWRKGKNQPTDFEGLRQYYYRCGGAAMARIHMKYDVPINRLLMFTQAVAIKPHIYEELIALWFDMCKRSAKYAMRYDMKEIGDQEFFSSATWKLGVKYGRGGEEAGFYLKHYGGADRKKDMMRDYHRCCKKINRIRQREG